MPLMLHGARVGAQQAGDHRERRGLAGAVRADDAVERAGAHVEVDAVDGGVLAEPLHESRDRQHRRRIGRRCCSRHAQRALLARRGLLRCGDHGDRLRGASGCLVGGRSSRRQRPRLGVGAASAGAPRRGTVPHRAGAATSVDAASTVGDATRGFGRSRRGQLPAAAASLMESDAAESSGRSTSTVSTTGDRPRRPGRRSTTATSSTDGARPTRASGAERCAGRSARASRRGVRSVGDLVDLRSGGRGAGCDGRLARSCGDRLVGGTLRGSLCGGRLGRERRGGALLHLPLCRCGRRRPAARCRGARRAPRRRGARGASGLRRLAADRTRHLPMPIGRRECASSGLGRVGSGRLRCSRRPCAQPWRSSLRRPSPQRLGGRGRLRRARAVELDRAELAGFDVVGVVGGRFRVESVDAGVDSSVGRAASPRPTRRGARLRGGFAFVGARLRGARLRRGACAGSASGRRPALTGMPAGRTPPCQCLRQPRRRDQGAKRKSPKTTYQ